MRTRKTETVLADGRALYYFDESPEPRRIIRDPRDLTKNGAGSEIRRDPLLDQWVIIASHRQERTYQPPTDQCPLCPSGNGRDTEVPADDYDVVVFENRFAALSATATASSEADDPLFASRPGVGRCEVVCFTSDHYTSLAALPSRRVESVIEVWADRTAELGASPGVEYVLCFENRGEEIGVTLSHPHGQIYAYPFVPPNVSRQLDSARRHRDRTGGCLFCDLVSAERRAGTRVIHETPMWTVVAPYAARWPFEAHVYSRRHIPDLTALTAEERTDLAEVYLDVLGRFDALFDAPAPYIAVWFQAPARGDRELAHLYAQIFSIRRAPKKLKFLGGSESGSGVWVNDVTPEDAARQLRAVGPKAL